MNHTFIRSLFLICAVLLFGAQSSNAATSKLVYNGAGLKLSMVFPDGPNMGIGMGGHMLFGYDLKRAGALALYPNMEIWYASGFYGDYSPNPPYPPYNGYDYSVLQFSLFLDTRYYFPVHSNASIKPYIGLGMGPVINNVHYQPQIYNDYTRSGIGMNFLAGIDFLLGSTGLIGFVELKGTVASPYPRDILRMTFGITFPY